MEEEISAYIDYLLSYNNLNKPTMPNFDLGAYNDNEYVSAINELMFEYDNLDDLYLTIQHIKGEKWK